MLSTAKTRIAFFGTPAAALPSFEALVTGFEVAVVVTRPDSAKGRSRTPTPSPVGAAAARRSLPVIKPRASGELADSLGVHEPLDVAVVVAFGMLIPTGVLAIPRLGFINLHFSVLPRWRGAAPVQRALIAGDTRTGVSLMVMDEGLDTGPVIAVSSTAFGDEETGGEATRRLATMGAGLLVDVLPKYLTGQVVPARQPDRGAVAAPRIRPEDRRLDLTQPARVLARVVRALSPGPGAFADLDGEPFKILRARVVAGALAPGEVVFESGRLVCGTGEGLLELIEVQLAGKPVMGGTAWARGHRVWPASLT